MKSILRTIFGFALIVLGEFLALHVYSSKIQGGFIMGALGIIAFVTILGGNILTVSFLFIYAESIEKWLLGKSKHLKTFVYSFLLGCFATPFVLSIITFYHFTGNYHNEQLKNYGVVKKVYLESEITGKNSRHDLCFHFEHDGKVWEGMLNKWKYTVGDSAEIIYSSENPNEKEWHLKYLERIKKNSTTE